MRSLADRVAELNAEIDKHLKRLGATLHGLYDFWSLVVDTRPDAEPHVYTVECAVCGDHGPVVEAAGAHHREARHAAHQEARRTAGRWAGEHRNQQREHLTYRLVSRTPYRIVPGRRT